MTPAIDETITRDLAALAADNRRGWRTADDALAALEGPRARLSSEAVTFIELTAIFARRVAWIASSGVGLAVVALILATTFWPARSEELDTAMLIEDGLIPALVRVVVPMLASYVLARRLAARWFVAGLQRSATPDAEARRLIRRVDGWATGLTIIAVAASVVLFGALFQAFYRHRWIDQWYDGFLDGTTRRTRMLPLPVAIAALAVAGAAIGWARGRLAWLGHPGWIPAGVIGIKLTALAGIAHCIWPFVQIEESALAPRVALTVAGTASVLVMIAAIVLGLRARTERRLAALPAAHDGLALLATQQALVQRVAWLATSIAAIVSVELVLEMVRQPSHLGWLSRTTSFFMASSGAIVQEVISWSGIAAFAMLAHLAGLRLAERGVARLVAHTTSECRQEVLQRQVDRLAPWVQVAVIAAITTVVVASAMTRVVFEQFWTSGAYDLGVLETSCRFVMLAIGLAVVVAIALGRAWHSAARRRLRHPATMVISFMIAAFTIRAASHVELSALVWGPGGSRQTGDFAVLRAALALGATASVFLFCTWAALFRGQRKPAG